jgi:hypothetical protein
MGRKEQRIDEAEDLRSACGKTEMGRESSGTMRAKLRPKCSRADRKAQQPTALFRGFRPSKRQVSSITVYVRDFRFRALQVS